MKIILMWNVVVIKGVVLMLWSMLLVKMKLLFVLRISCVN